MKQALRIGAACMVIGILFFAVLSAAADAQEFSNIRSSGRGGNWDFFLPLAYIDSATVKGENGSSVDLDATMGWGFGFGYNFNDHFNLNGMFTWSQRNYKATVVNTDGTNQKYNNTLYSSTFGVNGIYYLLSGDITPFVSAGIGMTYLDSNIQNGPASGSCWYDPWWGYVCNNYVPTKTQYDVSYNAGIGVRFDLSRQFSLQPSYNKMWVDINKSSGTPDFDIWRLDFVFRM